MEAAKAAGRLSGRDLAVIEMQIQRAEAKILNATRADATAVSARRAMALDERELPASRT